MRGPAVGVSGDTSEHADIGPEAGSRKRHACAAPDGALDFLQSRKPGRAEAIERWLELLLSAYCSLKVAHSEVGLGLCSAVFLMVDIHEVEGVRDNVLAGLGESHAGPLLPFNDGAVLALLSGASSSSGDSAVLAGADGSELVPCGWWLAPRFMPVGSSGRIFNDLYGISCLNPSRSAGRPSVRRS